MKFTELETTKERLELMKTLANRFQSRAHKVDVEGGFPFDNIQDLKDTGYTTLTVPKKYGGKGISLSEMIKLQELIAEGDGSTALAIGWHMGIIYNLSEKNSWKEPIFKFLCEQVMAGSLINSAATEPKTGSPTRGGRPETTAEQKSGRWLLNGRKTFTTMSPVLDYFIVSASLKGTEEIANFLIPRSAEGLKIEETWDVIAMRGTGSHDLVLEDVIIPGEYIVEPIKPGKKRAMGWLLHIPACYLGIAKAAKRYAINFAEEYSPNSIQGTIIDLPNVQQKIGEIELKIMQAEFFLYGAAKQWDESTEEEREKLAPVLGAAKLTVTNSAISIVDLAMRIVGAKSLSSQNPLQRYYRDVRAGLHNPPMDDMTIQLLAKHSITNN
ncbi:MULTISPECIES: acyl-CoA dehydrogenase family protein [Neobacillus]|uniref:Acyl-CoA/acyl-ACP dehydrogenase n=1 Tax=Neobacillus rhizophilus TaxID=2833579 RepID=A0A942U7C6_9BACI|nr:MULTISPECIES: acyl-CoA dehydrogenase family protein [Neobacillus]MBS4216070.1 acyl-CoA/acyl-ACP dehydrogenase [Neobacillus rhizophilus]MBU8919936.1 acyl-CoA/acyl-ACP dehydrogenase [Bacillus sp. FJAT-29953]